MTVKLPIIFQETPAYSIHRQTIFYSFVILNYYQSISFAGFVGEEMDPAPPLGFNLTYECPDGN